MVTKKVNKIRVTMPVKQFNALNKAIRPGKGGVGSDWEDNPDNNWMDFTGSDWMNFSGTPADKAGRVHKVGKAHSISSKLKR